MGVLVSPEVYIFVRLFFLGGIKAWPWPVVVCTSAVFCCGRGGLLEVHCARAAAFMHGNMGANVRTVRSTLGYLIVTPGNDSLNISDPLSISRTGPGEIMFMDCPPQHCR